MYKITYLLAVIERQCAFCLVNRFLPLKLYRVPELNDISDKYCFCVPSADHAVQTAAGPIILFLWKNERIHGMIRTYPHRITS